jgi:hydrogenase maturation factor
MHDPTEGELATGLREPAIAAGVDMMINEDKVLVVEGVARVEAVVIGKVVPEDQGMELVGSKGERDLRVFERDEIAAVFEGT